jgi:hypothetical protein
MCVEVSARTGSSAESMLAGLSRSFKKIVAAEGWGTVRVVPV